MPIIRKQKIDLTDAGFIGYDQIRSDDKQNADKFVHFFLDDYKFEVLWSDPKPRLDKLSQYKGVLSPQFSTYYSLPVALQIYNTFRSRWCGAYMQSKGLTVIPTVSWGLPESYWYCFDGIEKGSVVAVSTLGVRKEKRFFMQGYNEMLERIEPKAILCYSTPFDEMQGNVIPIRYSRTGYAQPTKSYYVHKTYVMENDRIIAGMGGGGGGTRFVSFPGWDPTKPPGEGYEWRGRGEPGSRKGSWYNPKTEEMMFPDLDHPEPIPPHWDYNYPGGGNGYRIFPDGTMKPKEFEGEMIYA